MDSIETFYNGSSNYACIIHLDRLTLTFRNWSGSTFSEVRHPDQIPSEQVFNNVTLIHDLTSGIGAYYHTFRVVYKGYPVGKLHAATKLKKHELQFDFAKEVFYSFSANFWYEAYQAIKSGLGLIFNNVNYIEICIDTNKNLLEPFGKLYQNCVNNKLRTGDRFRMRKNTSVNVMNNGASFIIAGTDNEVALYNKTGHSEPYIIDYFSNNGLNSQQIYRIESRLSWNYIRHLRSRKSMDITLETLLDPRILATIFHVSTVNKVSFIDLESKVYDSNRNASYKKITILDDLQIEQAEIGQLNHEMRISHYKTEFVDENIIRQNYFMYLESGKVGYLYNLVASSKVAGYTNEKIINCLERFNGRYLGIRTSDITKRMDNTRKEFLNAKRFIHLKSLASLASRLKLYLVSVF